MYEIMIMYVVLVVKIFNCIFKFYLRGEDYGISAYLYKPSYLYNPICIIIVHLLSNELCCLVHVF